MLLILVKLAAVLIAAVSISKSYLDYRKKQESRVMFLFWSIIWCAAAIIMVYPKLIDTVISAFQGQTVTLSSITGLALIFMLYIVYRIYTKAARIEYKQNEMIRKLGLAQEFKPKRTRKK
jgi:hypothetical protein